MANSATHKYISGAGQLTTALAELGSEVRARVLGVATRRAIQPILRQARINARRSERTGALISSLTDKVVEYPEKGKAMGLVGPARGYFHKGRKVSTVQASLLSKVDSPAKYAHLIEYGHHIVSPKKGTSRRKGTAKPAKTKATWVPAKPFLRPAVESTLAEQSAGFTEGIREGFEKAIARANKKAASTKK